LPLNISQKLDISSGRLQEYQQLFNFPQARFRTSAIGNQKLGV